jgi:hypothetical protein
LFGRTPEHRAFPFGDLNPRHATPNTHGVLPREPAMGEEPFAINLAVNAPIIAKIFVKQIRHNHRSVPKHSFSPLSGLVSGGFAVLDEAECGSCPEVTRTSEARRQPSVFELQLMTVR